MRRLPPRLSRLLPPVLVALTGLLVAFHAWLFWQRLVERALLQPQIGLRWLFAAALLAPAAALGGRGLASLFGRRAPVFWSLVVLLHAHAAATAPADPLAATGQPQALLFVLPTALGVLGALALLVAAAPRRAGRRRLPAARCVALVTPRLLLALPSCGAGPRAPPALAV